LNHGAAWSDICTALDRNGVKVSMDSASVTRAAPRIGPRPDDGAEKTVINAGYDTDQGAAA